MMYEKREDGKYQMLLFGRSDSHVKTSVLRESKKESKEERGAGYFLKLCGSLMKRKIINPDGLSLKTLKICSLLRGGGDSSQCSLKWKHEGTVSSGKCTTQKTTEYLKTGSGYTLRDILEGEVSEHYYLPQEKVKEFLNRL